MNSTTIANLSAPVFALPLFDSVKTAKVSLAAARESARREKYAIMSARRLEKLEKKNAEVKSRNEEKVEKNTRGTAFAAAFATIPEDGMDLNVFDHVANTVYISNGGESNLKEAKWYRNVMVGGLVSLGIVKISGGSIFKI